MKRKWLAIGIILLYAGTGILSASYTNPLRKVALHPKESLIYNPYQQQDDLIYDRGYFYGCCVYDPSGEHPFGLITFDTPDAVDSYPGPFIICSDIDENGNWYGIDGEGRIFDVYESVMVAQTIPLQGLAFNNQGQSWYGCTGSSLYMVDINTGATTHIGDFGSDYTMEDLTCGYDDLDLYGIGYNGTTSVLFCIDRETGETTEIGPTGLLFAIDAGYDRDNDYPYITGYSQQGISGLYTCDVMTGMTNLIGNFDGLMEVEALTIPYTSPDHYLFARFAWVPLYPFPGETILFDASESFGSNPIILYEWDWENDGVYDENYTIPTVTHAWASPGSYTVTLRVIDDEGLTATKSHIVQIQSNPPPAPIIHGPEYGYVNIPYTFTTDPITDPNGFAFYCLWNWGDGTNTDWLGPYQSGSVISASHVWMHAGVYEIKAKTKTNGGESIWSEPHTITIGQNQPPTTPIITGPSQGKSGISYNYEIESVDPENENISYYIDWADGTNTGWIGPYTSGQEQTLNHTWNKKGTYTIKAKARDNHDQESDWGTLTITMPYEPPQFPFIQWLLERFPYAFPILRYLLGCYE